ncbi:MAG: M15 family metallopeptidase [Mycobacteriales bacterium]
MSRRPAVLRSRVGRFVAAIAVLAVAGWATGDPAVDAGRAEALRVASAAFPEAPPAPVAPAPAPPMTVSPDRARPLVVAPVRELGARLRPDVLITGRQPLPADAVTKLAALSPEGGALAFRAGTVRIGDKDVRAVGVDPSTFRTFTAEGTAEATAVWQSVARGELVASHEVATALGLVLGSDVPVTSAGGPPTSLRLGALATTGVPGADLLFDDQTARTLGLPTSTAMLLTAGKEEDPVALAGKVRAITGTSAVVDLLTPPAADPVAFLTGAKAAKAFGAFSYRYFPDGTIEPDAKWVNKNIQSATLPIMGRVTCHRLMIPQLRGALQDVVDAGLAESLKTFDGCYVPRFIERNPENSISLHTWGIAIDMDASTNYRGITGTMNPEVVKIFKSWGFRWGGDWKYTDPMHFELAALLTKPRG